MEDVMSVWNAVQAIGVAAAGLLVLWMCWTAIERARLRRQWMRLPRRFDDPRAPFDWCVATAMAAGCV
jgi:hypothetical protein